MTRDDLLLVCSIAGVYPAKYDDGGWFTLLKALDRFGADVDELMASTGSLPKNRKEVETVATEVRGRLANRLMDSLVVEMDADKWVSSPIDKRDQMWNKFIVSVQSLEFPPYVAEVDPAVQAVITANFMYKYSNDGKPIVYSRVLDEQGTIWEEVPDGEHVFSKLKGEMRTKMMNALVIRSLSKTVTVFVRKGEESKIYEHVPFWRLFHKNADKIMMHVRGTPENVAAVREKLGVHIETLKRCFDGKLSHCELARGMQEIPKTLLDMDDNIDNMTFFYKKNFDFPMLTNDPAEPALAYFDLNNITEGPTPDFDGFMQSIHPACRDSLMAAIYATFFAKCRLNQYLWLEGRGGDGKSSLLMAMYRYGGERFACSLSAQDMKSEFGLENCVGKRMVIMSDVKSGLTVKSGLMHNLTGHDLVSINRKNKPVISVRLNPIVWVAANDAPDVNFDNRNEARRCIYIKLIEPPIEVQKKFYFVKEDGTFEVDADGVKQNNGYDLEGHLVAEMPHILYKCREVFNRVCPAPYSVIKQNAEAIHVAKENCLDIDAATFNTYIQETFSFNNKEATMLQTEIFEAMADTMKTHGERAGLNQFTKRDIRRLLTDRYGCERKKNAKGIYYMSGISRKVCDMTPVENPSTGRKVYIPPEDMKAPSVGDFV